MPKQSMPYYPDPERKAKIEALLHRYIKSSDFKKGVIDSTRAEWAGSGYSVELLPEQEIWYNVWWGQIGNAYETPGILIALPAIDCSTYEDNMDQIEDDFLEERFSIEEEELKIYLFDTWRDCISIRL